MKPIMILAGGTGGHIFPALAVAEELRRMNRDIVWVGSRDSMESEVVPRAGIEFVSMRVQGLRKTGWRRYLRIPVILAVSMIDAIQIFRKYRPCAVLGMGGFVSGPCGLMSVLVRVPLIIHEQNSILGLTNRILVRFSQTFFTGFPLSRKGAIHCGNPVRKPLLELGLQDRAETQSLPLHLLVIGGSQGARVLNEIVPRALAELSPAQLPEVLHQAGRGNEDSTKEYYQQAGLEARIEPFIEDMRAAYLWADLVICRSGAMTLAELSAVGLPSVLVPYPHAVDDHQTKNALQFVNAGAARLLAQAELTGESLGQLLTDLLSEPNNLLNMGKAAKKFTTGDAGVSIAQACVSACNKRKA